jgi:hypothetical protein
MEETKMRWSSTLRRICCETKVVGVETEGAVKVSLWLSFRLGTQEPVTYASGGVQRDIKQK